MTDSEASKNPESEADKGASEEFYPRRARLGNLFLAFKHINDASVADSVQQRISDYVTFFLVVVCIFSLVSAVALPVSPMLRLLPLLFTIGAVIFFMINRLGIIVSLSSRQALIVWHIVIASFWLGVTSAMLVMMCCFYFFSGGINPVY